LGDFGDLSTGGLEKDTTALAALDRFDALARLAGFDALVILAALGTGNLSLVFRVWRFELEPSADFPGNLYVTMQRLTP